MIPVFFTIIQLAVPPSGNTISPPQFFICKEKCPKPSVIHIVPVFKKPKLSLKIDKKEIEKLNIFFDFDSYTLKREEKKKIKEFIEKLNVPVKVYGYADCIGSGNYNYELSKKRALAVKKYIEKVGGVVKDVRGLGELSPPPGPEKRKVEIRGEK